jgi:hypothetical protein
MQSELACKLIEATCFASLAIGLALLLRTGLRRLGGPTVAYSIWLAVPVAIMVALLPSHRIDSSANLIAQTSPIKSAIEPLLVSVGPTLFPVPPEERIEAALRYGARIHPQYRTEFETGASVAWHRVPWTLGCTAIWTGQLRAQHYDNLCAIDNRIVLAGEHASRVPAWQEGALLSSLDAVRRLHERVLAA